MIQILSLIETMASNLTQDNIQSHISLVEKLIALAEAIKQDVSNFEGQK